MEILILREKLFFREGEPAKDGWPPGGVESMSRLGRETIFKTDRSWRKAAIRRNSDVA